MLLARSGELVKEDFTVTDENYNLVIDLEDGDFTRTLYDPDGDEVSSTITVVVTELGNGNYRATFTPPTVGNWYLVVYHEDYFPWGKANTIKVQNNDFDSLRELVIRILGLTQENFYIDNAVHDAYDNLISGRIRIYDDAADVGTDDGVISTYFITATYEEKICKTYKVVKI